MPTPVSSAKQCLTDEAARALDDAVVVARRRSHAQTTSLHAVSALLGLPSSSLREACARARGNPYSPRLQFRALELCVGVSLDRLPSSKTAEEPPVSNSLMAAIKRSQANQRRQPENFHLYQIHAQQQAAALLKVELKHFILSILDDPIVSRVFGDAGFRSYDIKLALLHPPVTQAFSPFPRARRPPIFLCNLTDSEPGEPNRSYPFRRVSDADENSRRIGEILVRKSRRNPLLCGYCANDALKSFTDSVQSNRVGFLPDEIAKLSLICIENEISTFVVEGGSKEQVGLRFKELRKVAERCLETGIVVNFGELKVLIGDGAKREAVSYVVEQLTDLLEHYGEKVWLIGSAGTDEAYLTFLARFPDVEKDWDLNLLPFSSSKHSIERVFSNSSLMGSFVPFGGFFTSPSNFKNPLSSINQPSCCHPCTEKYEQEIIAMLKVRSTFSVADQYSESLPPWLQMAEYDKGKRMDITKAKDDRTLNAKILGLQKKWNDICQRLHYNPSFTKLDNSLDRSQVSIAEKHHVPDRMESSSRDSSLNGCSCENPSARMSMDWQKLFPYKRNIQKPVASEAENVYFQLKQQEKLSKGLQIQTERPWYSPTLPPNTSMLSDPSPPSSLTSVTTDLGLGTLYASTSQKPSCPLLKNHKERLQHFSGSISAKFDAVSEKTSHRIAQASSCSGSNCGEQFDPRDFRSLRRILTEKVDWQDEAICAISQTVSRCKAGNRRHHGSSLREDIWLTFLGPDKVGKKKIAFALAEIMFGCRESLLSVDLGSHEMVGQSNSIFDCKELSSYDVKFWEMTIVDYVAGELRKKPYPVVFLENVEKADPLTRHILSQAIGTGKFPDSRGREISINNIIFITTSMVKKDSRTSRSSNEPIEFCEERILGAKSWQMQILIGSVAGDASRSSGLNVMVTPRKITVNVNKRKLIDISDSIRQENTLKTQKRPHMATVSKLDLNLPVEEMEEEMSDADCDSDANSENSEAWLEEFFDQVDENVVFKAFDFKELEQRILNKISTQFQQIFGSEVILEIDQEVMVQILAAAWQSDRKRAVEDWVEQVLRGSFAEAKQKYCLADQSVVKLVTCEGLPVKEQASGLCLPARINVN